MILNEFAEMIKSNRYDLLNEKAIEILEHLLDDEAKSYHFNWHPLGFIHAKLVTFENNETLRFHIWSDIERKPDDKQLMIHKHIFDLKSYVLTGKIKNVVYHISKKEKPHLSLNEYVVNYEKDYSILNQTQKKIKLCQPTESIILPGNVYSMSSEVFHESHVPQNSLASTLVLTHNQTKTSPIVAGEGKKFHKYKRKSCHFRIVRAALLEIISTLKTNLPK